MTAPTRAGYVDRGLRRLGIPAKKRHYFALHAVLDVKHSETWNREVVRSLVAEDARRAQAIGEGAVLRLWHGARCFDRYREQFQFVHDGQPGGLAAGVGRFVDRCAFSVSATTAISERSIFGSLEEGHEVKVSIANPLCRGTLAGLVEQTPDWRGELDWIRAAGRDGIILFENVAEQRGELQDELRARGLQRHRRQRLRRPAGERSRLRPTRAGRVGPARRADLGIRRAAARRSTSSSSIPAATS